MFLFLTLSSFDCSHSHLGNFDYISIEYVIIHQVASTIFLLKLILKWTENRKPFFNTENPSRTRSTISTQQHFVTQKKTHFFIHNLMHVHCSCWVSKSNIVTKVQSKIHIFEMFWQCRGLLYVTRCFNDFYYHTKITMMNNRGDRDRIPLCLKPAQLLLKCSYILFSTTLHVSS